MVSPGDVAAYHADGVLLRRGLLGPPDVREVRDAVDRYLRERLASVAPGDRVLEADGTSVRNLWRMERYDAFFQEFGERPDLRAAVAPLVRGTPELVSVETFNKPPRVGSGVPYHQDNAYFCQSPPDMLTLWIALDPVTAANGPVCYVRGSHTSGVHPHVPSGVKGNSMRLASPVPPGGEEFRALLEPGDGVFHHCQTVHRSEPNTTDRPRCGLLLVYRGTHTRTDPRLQALYDGVLANAPA